MVILNLFDREENEDEEENKPKKRKTTSKGEKSVKESPSTKGSRQKKAISFQMVGFDEFGAEISQQNIIEIFESLNGQYSKEYLKILTNLQT